MFQSTPNAPRSGRNDFQKITESFLSCGGLPFDGVLTKEKIHEVFSRHDCLFALGGIYSTAVVLWAFLGQVLRDGKEASCQFAVACVIDFCLLNDRCAPTKDTGDYCVARMKLSEDALHELSCEVASELEEAADPSWLWKGLNPTLIDGFNFTMPDTPDNQAVYPPDESKGTGVV